jgi:hypothetical protein
MYANIFVVRPNASPESMLSQTIVGIDRDGRAYLSVSPEQITDVQRGRLISFYPAQNSHSDGGWLKTQS